MLELLTSSRVALFTTPDGSALIKYQLDGLPIQHWSNKSGHQLAAPAALGNPAKEWVWLSLGLP